MRWRFRRWRRSRDQLARSEKELERSRELQHEDREMVGELARIESHNAIAQIIRDALLTGYGGRK